MVVLETGQYIQIGAAVVEEAAELNIAIGLESHLQMAAPRTALTCSEDKDCTAVMVGFALGMSCKMQGLVVGEGGAEERMPGIAGAVEAGHTCLPPRHKIVGMVVLAVLVVLVLVDRYNGLSVFAAPVVGSDDYTYGLLMNLVARGQPHQLQCLVDYSWAMDLAAQEEHDS